MKTLILILALFMSSAAAQDTQWLNPDGSWPSLHLTPVVSSGRVEYSTVLYPERWTTNSTRIMTPQLGFKALLKVPTSRYVTVQFFGDYKTQAFSYNALGLAVSLRQQTFEAGVTISIYFRGKASHE